MIPRASENNSSFPRIAVRQAAGSAAGASVPDLHGDRVRPLGRSSHVMSTGELSRARYRPSLPG